MASITAISVIQYIVSIFCEHISIVLIFFIATYKGNLLACIYISLLLLLIFALKLKIGTHFLWKYALKISLLVISFLFLCNMIAQILYLAGVYYNINILYSWI